MHFGSGATNVNVPLRTVVGFLKSFKIWVYSASQMSSTSIHSKFKHSFNVQTFMWIRSSPVNFYHITDVPLVVGELHKTSVFNGCDKKSNWIVFDISFAIIRNISMFWIFSFMFSFMFSFIFSFTFSFTIFTVVITRVVLNGILILFIFIIIIFFLWW